jgi:gliding motility-associated-like protein
MKKLLSSLLVFFAIMQVANAAHMRGGEIFWHCISPDNRIEINNKYNSNFTVADHGKFVFIAKLYGDCSGSVSILTNYTAQFVIGGYAGGGPTQSPPIFVSGVDISPDCFSTQLKWACHPNFNSFAATGPLNGVGATGEFVFRSNAFQLNGAPPQNGAWMISMNHCCRNTATNVSGQPNFFLKSEMYPYPNVPNPRAHGALPPFKPMFPCYDNSPEFLELPNVVSCNGYPFTYGPLAFDVELDSLVYDWAPPLTAITTPVPFLGGYSMTSPLPSTAPSVPAVLDPVTGLITFESHVNGTFTTNTQVLAYKCGIPVASIFRDVQIVTANCDAAYTGQNPPMPVPNNAPPSVTFIPDTTLTMTIPGNNIYRFTVEAGDLVEYTLNAQDFDLLPNSQFQTITFQAASGQLGGPNWNSTTNCNNPPCATIFPATGQTGFVSSLNNTIEFSWQTACSHLAANVGCGVFSNEYVFYLKMEDNFCPTPARTLITVVVDVQAGSADPPKLMCASRLPGGNVELTWLPPTDTGYNFNFYVVEIDSTGSGNFSPFDTVYAFNPGTHNVNVTSPSPNYFRIRANVGCNYLSEASKVVGTIHMNLSTRPINSVDKDTADLSWNSPRPNDTVPVTYNIYAEMPDGSGNWVNLGSTQNLDWTESVLVCELEVNFRIQVETFSRDSSFSCISYSNIDGAMFSDVTNNDTMRLYYATVNPAGRATIEFPLSPSGDIVEYYVLWQNDATGNWDIIDTVGGLAPYTWQASQADVRIEKFKVISADSCGNVSDDQLVIEHNTLLMESKVDLCGGTNTLTWNHYRGWRNSLMGYEIRADIDDQMGGVQPNVLLYSGGREDTTFVQTEFVSGAVYCYRVIARHIDSVTISESYPICMNPGVPNPSDMLYISHTEVRGDGIMFRGFADGDADANQIIIERARVRNGTYFEVAIIDIPQNPPYTFTYVDYLAKPDDGVYYYRLIAKDSCGGIDTISNIVNNIRVEVEAKRNDQNWVSWNSYKGFAGEIQRYQLYRSKGVDEGYFDLIADNISPNDTIFVDDLRGVEGATSTFCYYVRAVEANNPLDLPDGYKPFRSISNSACITQKAKLIIPNAFNPASPVEANRTFGVKNRFVDLTSFEFIIIDRWGRVVFETKDPVQEWDGAIGGKISPAGVYSYKIRYRTVGGHTEEMTGTFTLIH